MKTNGYRRRCHLIGHIMISY